MRLTMLKQVGLSVLFLGLAQVSIAGPWDVAVGDVLQVQVYDHAEFSTSLPVNNLGVVRIPFGNSVSVVGKSCEEVEKLLAKEFEKMGAVQPKVNVQIKFFSERRVYAIGALTLGVKKDMIKEAVRGIAVIPEYGKLTVLQALSAVGGVSDAADLEGVFIRRTGKDGKLTCISVPMKRLISGESIKDIELMPEDVIVVPRLGAYR